MQTGLTPLTTLRAAGFTFPHELGLFRHPLLSDDGLPADAQTRGFTLVETGGGCEALELQAGEFVMVLTSEDGCYAPESHEWSEALIGVYNANRDELIVVSGKQWLELVQWAESAKD